MFDIHGKMSVSVENSIVILDIEGPLNLEFFQYMAAELKKLPGTKIDINNYAALVIFRGEALSYENAIEFFVEFMKTVQVKAVALNLSHANSPSFSRNLCERAYKAAGINHRFFDSNEEGKAWLTTFLHP